VGWQKIRLDGFFRKLGRTVGCLSAPVWFGRLGDVRGKVMDSSGNAKSFDFAGEPGDLMFLQFGVKEASE